MSDTPASFAHITVTPEEEEDFVIEAGVRARPAAESAPAEVAEPASAPAPEPDPAPASEAVKAPEPDAAQPAARAGKPARKAKGKAAYEPTTLDDLKGEPMSLTQKVVIVAAIVCLIGAVAYYFLFMR